MTQFDPLTFTATPHRLAFRDPPAPDAVGVAEPVSVDLSGSGQSRAGGAFAGPPVKAPPTDRDGPVKAIGTDQPERTDPPWARALGDAAKPPEAPPVPTPELLEELSRQVARAYAGLSALESLLDNGTPLATQPPHRPDPALIRVWAQSQIRTAAAALKIDIRL